MAVTFDDDSVGIMQFILDPRLPGHAELPGWDKATGRREATDEAIEHEVTRSAWGERTPVNWRRILFEDIPTDRGRSAPRGAMSATGSTSTCPTARELHRARLRELRAPLLAELDVAYQRADEVGDAAAKQKIAARKRALRDVTAHPDIDTAATPEQLMAVLPAPLGVTEILNP